jgi:hypothetical protein
MNNRNPTGISARDCPDTPAGRMAPFDRLPARMRRLIAGLDADIHPLSVAEEWARQRKRGMQWPAFVDHVAAAEQRLAAQLEAARLRDCEGIADAVRAAAKRPVGRVRLIRARTRRPRR